MNVVVARGLAWLAVILGVMVMIGWATDLPILRSVFPGQVEAKANTAVGLILTGVALVMKTGRAQSASHVRQRIAGCGAGVAGLTGLLTLAEYAFGRDFGIDEWLFRDAVDAAQTSHPGRMAVPTAFNFILLSVALLVLQTGRGRNQVTWLVVPVILQAGLAFLGQLYDFPWLASFGPYTPIAVPTGIAFLGLSLGVLFAEGGRLVDRLRRHGQLAGFFLALLLFLLMAGAVLRNTRLLIHHTREVTVGEGQQTGQQTRQERQSQIEASTRRTLLSLGLGLAVGSGLLVTIVALLRREVARRTQAEAALRRSEEKLAVTLHSIGDAVLATDREGRVTLMNRMAEQLTGWTFADACGRLIAEVFRIHHEETRRPARIPVDDVLATGRIHGLADHTVLIARDGAEHAIADSAAPIRDRDAEVIGVVLVFRDVTAERAAERARRESEVRYRTLFDSIDEGFCVIEMMFDERGEPADYRFLEINPSFEKQTGLHDALGRTMRELAPRHEAHWFEIYGRVALTGEAVRFQNRAEELHRRFDVYAFRFGDPGKRQVAILFRDITELKRAEEEIQRLNADLRRRATQLESTNRELESFSYSVSHDLRAPLRHVRGYVEMLACESQSQLSSQARHYLQTITEVSRDMDELINDLLTFSRMGRTEMQEAVIDPGALVAEVRRSLEIAMSDREIQWQIGVLPQVRGDGPMLRQVWVNLLGNAVKYTRHRRPARIEVGCSGMEDGRVVLFVRDNGAGFDMQHAGKLFGVFQRLHRADEFEGTGIGLASVHRVITRHGGRVWTEARVEAGATFFFTLVPAPADPAAPPGGPRDQ